MHNAEIVWVKGWENRAKLFGKEGGEIGTKCGYSVGRGVRER